MSKNNTDDKKTNINYVTSFRNLVKKLGDKDKIMTNEFENNSVLTVQFTKTTLFILLRNGIVLSYDLDTKKKDKRSYKERGLPREIKTPSKLVDLVCGKEHCLARGIDNKVYAWGSNSNGQLGLGREIKDTMDIPKEIKAEYFEYQKVISIYAKNSNSYAITENLNLFGWGSNEYGELLTQLTSNIKTNTYEHPKKLAKDPVSADFTIIIKPQKSKIYICEFSSPYKAVNSSNLSDFSKIKQTSNALVDKETDLIKRLEEKEKIPKVRVTLEDYDALINEINQLKYIQENQINKLVVLSQDKIEHNKKKIKNLDTQMKSFSNEDNTLEKAKKRSAKLDIKRLEFEMSPSVYISKDNDKKENTNSQDKSDNYFHRVKETDNRDWLNTELQYRKHSLLNEHLKKDSTNKEIANKKNDCELLINILKEVEMLTKIKTNDLLDSLENFETIRNRYITELESFKQNQMGSETHSCFSETLNECLEKANQNLAHFEEKSENVKIDQRRDVLVNINSMFLKNIKLEMQNNILIKETINYSGRLYNKLLERAIKVENHDNFNEYLDRIEKIKHNLHFKSNSNDQTYTATMTEQEESEYYNFTESFDN